MPIVTLSWSGNGDIAYGPRGTRYELTKTGELYDVYGYSPDRPGGWKIAGGLGREDALLAAQRDCENLTAEVGAESDAIASAGRTQLQRR